MYLSFCLLEMKIGRLPGMDWKAKRLCMVDGPNADAEDSRAKTVTLVNFIAYLLLV